MHGCVKIRLHQPLWGSVPTHTKSFCKLATTSTAAPEQWDVMLRGWGAVHGEDVWHRVRCRTGAKRPTQPPESMQPQREWARATHSCPYAARAQCRATGKCPIPTPVQRHWLACDSSLRLPLNWGEDFQEVWAAAALAGVCYVIQQQQQPRLWLTEALWRLLPAECRTPSARMFCAQQPDPWVQVWSVSGISEDQGVLRGCVCSEHFQGPWTGQGPVISYGCFRRAHTISRDEQVLAQNYFDGAGRGEEVLPSVQVTQDTCTNVADKQNALNSLSPPLVSLRLSNFKRSSYQK